MIRAGSAAPNGIWWTSSSGIRREKVKPWVCLVTHISTWHFTIKLSCWPLLVSLLKNILSLRVKFYQYHCRDGGVVIPGRNTKCDWHWQPWHTGNISLVLIFPLTLLSNYFRCCRLFVTAVRRDPAWQTQGPIQCPALQWSILISWNKNSNRKFSKNVSMCQCAPVLPLPRSLPREGTADNSSSCSCEFKHQSKFHSQHLKTNQNGQYSVPTWTPICLKRPDCKLP